MDLEHLLRNASSSKDELLRQLDHGKDQLLRHAGLAQRSRGDDLLGAIGAFGAGVVVGAGLALLLAPRSGRELREQIGTKVAHGLGRDDAEETPVEPH